MFGLLRKLENSEPSHKPDYKMYRTVPIDKTLFSIVFTLNKQILPKFVFQRYNQTWDWEREREETFPLHCFLIVSAVIIRENLICAMVIQQPN